MMHRPNMTLEIVVAPEFDIQELAVTVYAGERLASSRESGMAAVAVSVKVGAQMERLLTRIHGALVSTNVLAVFVLPSEYKQQLLARYYVLALVHMLYRTLYCSPNTERSVETCQNLTC
jgi:hypothetical protein